jgi:hypothetical protein
MQSVIRQYRDETGETDVDMKKVAQFAVQHLGWPLSQPVDPIELLAKEFSRAAREEIKHDQVTGKPYRVNHAIPAVAGQLRLWIDIDHTTRPKMLKSLINRREQMVGDGLQLSYDADHWNSINPNEEPIQIPLDFTDDVEWRKNAPDEGEMVG